MLAGAALTKTTPRRTRAAERRLARARERLSRTRASLVDLAAASPEGDLARAPGGGGWTALEVLEHLILVERSVIGLLATPRREQGLAPREPLAHLVRALPVAWRLQLVARRIGKVPAPSDVRPAAMPTKAQALAGLAAARRGTLAHLERGGQTDELARIRRQHPILGTLDGIQWIEFIAAHERRHCGQIADLLAHRGA